MNLTPKQARKLWIAELRSGKHQQCKSVLTQIDGEGTSHCCLGVACLLMTQNEESFVGRVENDPNEGLKTQVVRYKHPDMYGSIASLPNEAFQWLGVNFISEVGFKVTDGMLSDIPCSPELVGTTLTLASLNDNYNFTFAQIADFIEKYEYVLFKKPELTPEQKSWIDALRSGDFAQCTGSLTKINGLGQTSHCCLGVACELAVAKGVPVVVTIGTDPSRKRYDDIVGVPPESVLNWLGLKTITGQFLITDEMRKTHPELAPCHVNGKGSWQELTQLNDKEGWSFAQIADFVEMYPEAFFI